MAPITTPTTQVQAQSLLVQGLVAAGLPLTTSNFDLITLLCAGTGNLLLQSPAFGTIGLASGQGLGSSVTQGTSKITAFTVNTPTGRIITATGALAAYATSSSATWTCSAMGTNDAVVFTQNSGTIGSYTFGCLCSAGQGQFVIANVSSASLNEVVAVEYMILKGAVS